MKQPTQMRMIEAMVVEASRWVSLTTNTFKVGITFSIFDSSLGDKYRQQVPEAAPEKHGGDKVGGSEEAGEEDAEKVKQ